MLGRRREQILIICGLIGVNILLVWFLQQRWKDYRSRTQWLYVGAPARSAPTLAPSPRQARLPQSFVEIVDRNLFNPLRGSPPPQPQEEAKPPKLPVLFGTMNLGDGRFALMAPSDQPSAASKRVLPGEDIAGYKLVSVGTSNVVLEWQEKKVTLDISDSVRRAPGIAERTASTRVVSVSRAEAAPSSMTSTSPIGRGPSPPSPVLGPPGAPADAPIGTVVDGKRKILLPTPFGNLVQWVDATQPGTQAPQQTGAPNK